MNDLFDLIARPHSRSNDIDTSRDAAKDAQKCASRGCRVALRALSVRPMTDHELTAETGWQKDSIAKRRTDLRDAGLVRAVLYENGKPVKRITPAGSQARVWEITETGISFLDNLDGFLP